MKVSISNLLLLINLLSISQAICGANKILKKSKHHKKAVNYEAPFMSQKINNADKKWEMC